MLGAVLFLCGACLLALGSAGSLKGPMLEERLLEGVLALLEREGLGYGHPSSSNHKIHRREIQQAPGLAVRENSDARIEGTFVTGERERGGGLAFLCEDDGKGMGKLQIATAQGDTVFSVLDLRDKVAFVSNADSTLLVHKSSLGSTKVYKGRSSLLHMLTRARTQQATESNSAVRSLLQSQLQHVTEEEGVRELEEMLNLPVESQILRQAIMALASAQEEKREVSGVGRSLRAFLAFGLRLEARMAEALSQDVSSDLSNAVNRHFLYDTGNKAAWLSQARTQTEMCTTFATRCPEGRCPYPLDQNDCFGMCGRQCNCWRFLCGDCCTHRGCIEHDSCCRSQRFYAIFRCNVPLGFTCGGPFRC